MTRDDRRFAATAAVVPLAFFLSGLAARIALLAPPQRIAVDLAQPLPVVTSWLGFGAGLWALLAITVAVAAAALLRALRLLRAGEVQPRTAVAVVLVAAMAALVAALSWPVLFSSDVYAYAAYGDEARRGLDPYAPLPAGAYGSLIAAARWQWGGSFPVCVYGTAFVAVSRGLVTAGAGIGPAGTLLLFRVCACAALIAAALALHAVLVRGRPAKVSRGDAAALAAFVLNPVALWSAAEGHNDALMLAAALVGAALVCWRPFASGVAIGLSSLLKAPGLAAGAAVAAYSVLAVPRRLKQLVAGLAVGSAAVGALIVPHALAVAMELGRHGRYAPQYSLQALGAAVLRTVSPAPLAAATGIGLAVLGCVALALRGAVALRGGDRAGFAWLGTALWLLIPNPYPWYALWVLPIAVLALDRPPFAALWAVTISIVVRYLPDAYGTLSSDQQTLIALAALAPLLFAFRGLRARRAVRGAAPS